MNKRRHSYTEQELRKAIEISYSIAQVLKYLGIRVAGGNYQTIKDQIYNLSIDTSHFTGKGWLKNKTHTYKLRNINEVLTYGKPENTYRLKNRILDENIKKYICECCNLTEWLNSPIPLELHHKDGDRKNNNISNLELLCPNCHAKTENYRGKNKIRRL